MGAPGGVADFAEGSPGSSRRPGAPDKTNTVACSRCGWRHTSLPGGEGPVTVLLRHWAAAHAPRVRKRARVRRCGGVICQHGKSVHEGGIGRCWGFIREHECPCPKFVDETQESAA